MILLDTNVVSETLKPAPSGHIIAWLDNQPQDELFFSAPSLAQMLSGLATTPDGKRKSDLAKRTAEFMERTFGERIHSFDAIAAKAFAIIASDMRRRGRAISVFDCQIAAIAMAHGLTIATRDTQPFADAGVPVVNPWAE